MVSNEKIIEAIIYALREKVHPRFFETERGYQAEFYSILRQKLKEHSSAEFILEQEYQKQRGQHKTRQRPDIILHTPAQGTTSPRENNFAAIAFKLKANINTAQSDFEKLDEMFEVLNYKLGIFINVNSQEHYLRAYAGNYKSSIHSFAVRIEDSKPMVIHAFYTGSNIIEEIT